MEEASNVLFRLGPVEITSTVTTIWGIVLVLTVLSFFATRNMKDIPGPLQAAAEIAVKKLREYFSDFLGKELADRHLPILGTFFIFIIVSNYSGLLPGAGHVKGFSVPTACLSVTAALGIAAFFTTHAIGISELGARRYLGSFLTVLLPLELIEQCVRPVSLALRLFGNLYGEEQVSENLYTVFPIVLPLIMQVLSLLFCLIQAKVFTMLLSLYVASGLEAEH